MTIFWSLTFKLYFKNHVKHWKNMLKFIWYHMTHHNLPCHQARWRSDRQAGEEKQIFFCFWCVFVLIWFTGFFFFSCFCLLAYLVLFSFGGHKKDEGRYGENRRFTNLGCIMWNPQRFNKEVKRKSLLSTWGCGGLSGKIYPLWVNGREWQT